VSSISTGVNIFHADWTVVVGSVGDTFVWPVFRKAETTGLTVDEFVPSSDPADSTTVAVELSFGFIIKQFAHRTEICSSEHRPTVSGLALSTNILSEVAQQTLHLHHIPPLHRVILSLVVTEPAVVSCITARSNEFAFPLVVAAAKHVW